MFSFTLFLIALAIIFVAKGVVIVQQAEVVIDESIKTVVINEEVKNKSNNEIATIKDNYLSKQKPTVAPVKKLSIFLQTLNFLYF